jgi:hypothetical protein
MKDAERKRIVAKAILTAINPTAIAGALTAAGERTHIHDIEVHPITDLSVHVRIKQGVGGPRYYLIQVKEQI